MPDELIEAEWEGGRVYLGNADTIARPLRLGRRRGPGPDRRAARAGRGPRAGGARRRRPRPRQARGGHRQRRGGQRPRSRSPSRATSRPSRWPPPARALAGHRRLHLRYLVPARDEATERDVDPMRVVNLDAHWYLEGWCHRAEDVRLFRIDRIEAIEVLDEDGTPPADARPRDLDAGVFTPSPTDLLVRLRLEPGRRLGQRLLPDRVGRVARRVAARWSRCARPTPLGCAGCCGGWGRRRPSWSRPPSRPRCASARRRPCAAYAAPDLTSLHGG